MEEYFQDIFYNVNHLKLSDKIELLKYAKNMAFNVEVNDMPGYHRRKINMPFERMLEYITEKDHFVFIHRRGYDHWKNNEFFQIKWCIEVGYTTYGSPKKLYPEDEFEGPLFLFIRIKEDLLDVLTTKFNLNPNE